MSEISQLARGIVMAGLPGGELASPRFAGYVLFARDGTSPAGVRRLTGALRACDGAAPPVIAIDQEGGPVARLREGVEAMPPMMALGAAGDAALAQRAGEQVGFDLRRAGCTLDLAPVLDLALEPAGTVIGTRSFGSDPAQVAALGGAFARGLQRSGVLPCFKHFPGHGATAADSHVALPVVECGEATLRGRDLAAFAAVARDAPAMMTAHVLVRAFDAQRPATLSRRVATTILRDELGFRGALITDCLEMQAVASGGTGTAVDALAAGADCVLFSHDSALADAAAAGIEAAVRDGRLPLERLRCAHARVLRLRRAGTPPLPLDAVPPHPGIGREVARRGVTLLRGFAHADPVASVAVSFGGAPAALEREASALVMLPASIEPEPDETAAVLDSLDRLGRRPLLLARRAHHHRAQAAAIARILRRHADALVVSLCEPFDLPLFPAARHLLAAYGDDPASMGGLCDVLFGGSAPTGSLPVRLRDGPDVAQ